MFFQQAILGRSRSSRKGLSSEGTLAADSLLCSCCPAGRSGSCPCAKAGTARNQNCCCTCARGDSWWGYDNRARAASGHNTRPGAGSQHQSFPATKGL